MKVQKMLKSLMAAIGVALLMTGSLFAANAGTSSALPKATVTKLPAITLTKAAHSYMCWPSGDDTVDRPLQIVMNFKAQETLEEAKAGAYGKYKCDFYLSIEGLADSSIVEIDGVKKKGITANNCYLAGNYGTFGWIVIPTDGLPLAEGISYPVVSGYDANLTYEDICGSVEDFTAAIYVDPEILKANPDFKVTLALKMTDPNDASNVLTIGEPATYTVDLLMPTGKKPTMVIPEGVTAPEGIMDNAAVEDIKVKVPEEVKTFEIKLAEVDSDASSVTKVTFNVEPKNAEGAKVDTPSKAITFRLPIPSTWEGIVKVSHDGDLMGKYAVLESDGDKYVELTSATFSEFAVEQVLPVEVATYDALVTALGAGDSVKLTADITMDTKITCPDGVTIDLNGKTLSINVENSYYNNVTIKNGTIVLGKDDVHVCDGYFLVNAGKTLVLNGVTMNSSAEGIKGYAVFHLKTGANLDLNNSTLNISNNEYSAGYIVYAGEATATVDIVGTTVTGSKVNGIVYATTKIESSTFTVTDAIEHGINRSGVTIKDSTVAISGGTGRGITAQHGSLVIEGNSSVTISDMGEATIELRDDKNLTVADTATVKVDVAVHNTTSGTVNGNVSVDPILGAVVAIDNIKYSTLAEALTAAKAMTGDVTVEIYEKVTLNSALSGNYSSITFVGKDTDAEIYLDVQGYITATGKTVNFQDLTLSKSQGGFITNAGFMNVAFGIYDVVAVNYTKCVFDNGAYASSGDVTFTSCTFKKSWDKYGLWAYGNVNCVIESCTFDNDRGIKMYAEDKAKTTDLTVKNSDFSKLTGKPAIVLTYGESVNLEGNTYSSTGTFELDLDGAPNGVAVTSDVIPTCKNDNGACGVLVDGKIYTTVAQAAEVATSSSTVTLLHNSTETVVFAEGVTLNKNGFMADGVTVFKPIAMIGATGYATLQAAIDAVKNGETIKLVADVTEELVTIEKASGLAFTIDGDDKKFTGKFDLGIGESISIKKINFVASAEISPDYFIDAFGQNSNSILTIQNCTFTDTDYSTTAIGTQQPTKVVIDGCSATGVASLLQNQGGYDITVKNTTVEGKRGISLGTVVGATVENVTINAADDKYGIRLNGEIANNTITIKDCKITAFIPVVVRKAQVENYNVVFDGTNTMTPKNEDGLWCAIGTNEYETNGTMPTAPTGKVTVTLKDTGLSAAGLYGNYYVASVNGATYATLAEAVAAAQTGDTIVLKAGEYELPAFSGKELTFKGESKDGVIINDAPDARSQNWNGSIIHFENLTAKGATANYHGLANGVVAVTYKDCIIKGLRFLYANEVSFESCAFNAEGVEHSFWTYGAPKVTVTGCSFTYTDRAVNCYSENGSEHELDIAFTGCTFIYAGTADAPEGAVEINSGSAKSIELSMNECTAPEKGAMWYNSQWDSKKGQNTVVIIDDVPVWKPLKGSGTAEDPVLINDLADLILFRDNVNAGNTFDNQFIKLTDDIDLGSVVWIPIGNATTKFLGTFDGDGKTISNLIVDIDANNAGLFGYASVIKNLTVNNAKVKGLVSVGAMVGELENSVGTLDNCHVTGRIEVTGENSVGGLAGKGYANIRNSSVIGDDVATSFVLGVYGTTEEGDNIGGLIGHLGEGNTLGVANSTVKNIRVVGTRKIGGLVGTTARGNDYVGNTVENVIVESTATAKYADENAATCTIGGIIGNYFGSATSGGILNNSTVKNVTFVLGNAKSAGALVGGDRNNNGGAPVGVEASGSVVENVTGATVSHFLVAQIGNVAYETLEAAFAAAKANDTITLLADVNGAVTVDESVTIEGNGKTYTGKMTVDNNLAITVQNLNFVNGGIDKSTKGTAGTYTIKGCSFDGAQTYAYPICVNGAKTVIVEDCTVKNYQYSFLYVKSGTDKVSVKNVSVEGCPSYAVYFASGVNNAMFENLTVKNSANGFIIDNTAVRALTIKDCTMVGVETAINHKGGDKTITCTALGVNDFGNAVLSQYVNMVAVKVGNVYCGDLQTALDIAEKANTEAIVIDLLTDATLDITAWETLAIGADNTTSIKINGNGKTLTFNKLNSDWNHIVTKNNAKLILNDMTITDSGYNNGPWNRYDICFACDVELNDVTSKALAFKANATLNNVAVKETNDAYAIWIQPNGQNVVIDGLTVDSAGRGIKIDEQYVDAASKVGLSVQDATFTTAKKAAIVVKSAAGADITLENVNISGVAADNMNAVWNDEDSAASYGKITVTGGNLAQEGAAEFVSVIKAGDKVSGYYKSIQDAVVAAKDGDTVTVVRDHELVGSGATIDNLPVFVAVDGKAITIDLNGKAITGTSGSNNLEYYAAFAVDNDGCLTLKDSVGTGSVSVTGEYTMYSLLMAYEYGDNKKTKLVVEGGSYYLEKAHDCLVFSGEETDSGLVQIAGGTFNLGNVGLGENGKPWIFNVYGSNDNYVVVDGGTFNANINRQHYWYEVRVNQNKALRDNGDGTWTVVDAVAYVENQYWDGMKGKPIGYATLADAVADVDPGKTITLLADATLDYGAREAYGRDDTEEIVINGDGHTLTLNQTNSDWSSIGMKNAEGKLTLKNMTIEKTGYGDTSGAWNKHAIIFSCAVEMTDVTVNNGIAVQNGATLTNVTINEANGYYGLWINGNGQTVTVNGGEINATNGGRGIKIADQYIDSPASVNLSVTGTKFNTAKKAAVLVSSKAGADITATGVDISNVAEDTVNVVWVDEDWAAYYNNVAINGGFAVLEGDGAFAAIRKVNDSVVGYYTSIQAALNAAETGDNEIVLLGDSDEVVTVSQTEGKNITIDGDYYTYTGTINIHGNSRFSDETLTIRNFYFYTEEAKHDFIWSDSQTAPARYPHNVTVIDCEFEADRSVADSVVGVRVRQGNDINVLNCSAYRLHSLIQAQSCGDDGIYVASVNIVMCKNGMSFGTSNFSVVDSQIDTTGADSYGIRADGSGAYTATVEDCVINAYIPVLVRNTSNEGFTLTVAGDNHFKAANELMENGESYLVVFSKSDVDGDKAPVAPETTFNLGIEDGGLDPAKVYPGFEAFVGTKYFGQLEDAVAAAQNGDTVTVLNDVGTDAAIVINKQVTINLNGKTIAATENDKVGDGVFCVVEGGDLTINDSVGTGTINGKGGNDYNIAIWANGGKVTINGGNFTNIGATDSSGNPNFDLIYVKNGGEVVINGGHFECETPAFTLNSHDTLKGTITVNGGTFVGFDPRNNAAETAGTTFMAPGKFTMADGNNNYVVVKPDNYKLNGDYCAMDTVADIDAAIAGAVELTKNGDQIIAEATFSFKVTAVDTINPENSEYELTGGTLRPGKSVKVKYIDLENGGAALSEKPTSGPVIFKLVVD